MSAQLQASSDLRQSPAPATPTGLLGSLQKRNQMRHRVNPERPAKLRRVVQGEGGAHAAAQPSPWEG